MSVATGVQGFETTLNFLTLLRSCLFSIIECGLKTLHHVLQRIFVGLRIAPNGGQILAIGCSPRKFLNPDSTQCFMYSLHFTYCCNDVTLNNIYPYCNSWTSIVCLSLLAQLADQGCHFWRKSPIRRHFWRNSDRKASLLAQIADMASLLAQFR